jgi:hypothetical protein
MEVITIFLTSLMTIVGMGGIIPEQELKKAISDRVTEVETLAVRIDNIPAHGLLKGKVDKLSIATRGLFILSDVRIAVLEIETESIELANFSVGDNIIQDRQLAKPLQLGMRLVLNEDDLNQALQSPVVRSYLQAKIPPSRDYQLVAVRVNLMADNKVELQIQLESRQNKEPLNILVNCSTRVRQGQKLEIIEPVAFINDRKVSPRFLNRLINRITEDLDLKSLESQRILARILQLEINEDTLNLSAFVRLEQLPDIKENFY